MISTKSRPVGRPKSGNALISIQARITEKQLSDLDNIIETRNDGLSRSQLIRQILSDGIKRELQK